MDYIIPPIPPAPAGYDVIIKRLEKTVDDGSDAIRSF